MTKSKASSQGPGNVIYGGASNESSVDGLRLDNAKPVLKGAQLLAKALQAEGVSVVFGYPGGANLEIFDVLPQYGIRVIRTEHAVGNGAALDANQQARLIDGAQTAANGWPALDVHTRLERIQAWVSEVSVAREEVNITIGLESMIAALIDDAAW
jgi:hypothetical protein